MYKNIFDNKLEMSKDYNNWNHKDVVKRHKSKEYEFPPLPNLVLAKNEFL